MEKYTEQKLKEAMWQQEKLSQQYSNAIRKDGLIAHISASLINRKLEKAVNLVDSMKENIMSESKIEAEIAKVAQREKQMKAQLDAEIKRSDMEHAATMKAAQLDTKESPHSVGLRNNLVETCEKEYGCKAGINCLAVQAAMEMYFYNGHDYKRSVTGDLYKDIGEDIESGVGYKKTAALSKVYGAYHKAHTDIVQEK